MRTSAFIRKSVRRSVVATTTFLLTLAVGLLPGTVTTAGADTIRVDAGPTVNAGKVIIGSGQNLPSMGSPSPWNIGPYPADRIQRYQRTDLTTDQAEVASSAVLWTRSWLRRTCGGLSVDDVRSCRAMAVFDVDDTLLSSYPVNVTNDPPFSYDPQRSDAAVRDCSTPVIQPVRQAYDILRSWGVATAIVTGRPENQRNDTLACLAAGGMPEWDAVHLRPIGDAGPAATFKYDVRTDLISRGWRIGPSIGDQVSDMSFGALGRGFLLPNLRYWLP